MSYFTLPPKYRKKQKSMKDRSERVKERAKTFFTVALLIGMIFYIVFAPSTAILVRIRG